MTSKAKKRKQHILEMREKLERHTGQPASLFVPDGWSESDERFLEHVLAIEGVDEIPLFDALVKGGIDMPEPDVLGDADLNATLWRVIRGMAVLGHYLDHTDHLSDRELYRHLWTDVLREPTSLVPSNPYFACHIDILGGWSEEDVQVYLKYYAEEDEREDWAADCPDETMPAPESPPFDRDRFLPGPPVPPGPAGAESK